MPGGASAAPPPSPPPRPGTAAGFCPPNAAAGLPVCWRWRVTLRIPARRAAGASCPLLAKPALAGRCRSPLLAAARERASGGLSGARAALLCAGSGGQRGQRRRAQGDGGAQRLPPRHPPAVRDSAVAWGNTHLKASPLRTHEQYPESQAPPVRSELSSAWRQGMANIRNSVQIPSRRNRQLCPDTAQLARGREGVVLES